MRPGRPRRASTPDKAADALVRSAVAELADDLRRRHRRQKVTPSGSEHLFLAVTAARLAAAADRLAHAHVTLARETDGLTWERIGEAFGTSRQSAHERFRTSDGP